MKRLGVEDWQKTEPGTYLFMHGQLEEAALEIMKRPSGVGGRRPGRGKPSSTAPVVVFFGGAAAAANRPGWRGANRDHVTLGQFHLLVG